MINEVSERVKPKQIILTVDDKVKAKLTREGYNPLFGLAITA
jgi:ATP-dependent Clp protease ATP-binding subunit ClpA